MMFKVSEEYKVIKRNAENCGILNMNTHFGCYMEGILGYQLEHNGILHEFTFICDDILMDEMTVSELLDLQRLDFFCHNTYELRENDNPKNLTSVNWTMREDAKLN